jgi:predicted transcriptional regulator
MPLVVWTRSLLLFSATSKGSTVKTVTLDVRPPTEAMADFAQAWKTGKGSKADRISFATPELLWKALTAKRWELLKALCGAGPVTVREAARRVSRDVKAVHAALSALLSAGVLSRTESGQVEFPYEAVKVEFLLQAA